MDDPHCLLDTPNPYIARRPLIPENVSRQKIADDVMGTSDCVSETHSLSVEADLADQSDMEYKTMAELKKLFVVRRENAPPLELQIRLRAGRYGRMIPVFVLLNRVWYDQYQQRNFVSGLQSAIRDFSGLIVHQHRRATQLCQRASDGAMRTAHFVWAMELYILFFQVGGLSLSMLALSTNIELGGPFAPGYVGYGSDFADEEEYLRNSVS
ncbi:MAG: hypothetical protein Q9181_008059 [Wetmoreana brouardii]